MLVCYLVNMRYHTGGKLNFIILNFCLIEPELPACEVYSLKF